MAAVSNLELPDNTLQFLGRNPSLARELAKNIENRDSFIDADASDRASHTLDRFRGIKASSPFYTQPLGSFRGLYGQPATYDSQYAPISKLPDQNRLQYLLNSAGIDLEVKTDAEKEIDTIPREPIEDTVYLETSPQVKKMLQDPGDLHDSFLEDDVADGVLLESELAGFTENVIDHGIGEDHFIQNSETGRLLLEDRADLAEEISGSHDLQDLFDTAPDGLMLDRSRERVREAVMDKLSESSDILDESFFKEYPLVALYLLEREDRVHWVEENRANATQLKKDAGRITEEMRSRLAEEASERVVSLPFTQSFFEDNNALAETVWNDEASNSEDAAGNWMESVENYSREEALPTDLAHSYWSELANSIADQTIPDHLLSEDAVLGMIVSSDGEIASKWADENESIDQAYPDLSFLSPKMIALRAYSLGIGDSLYGDYQRVF